MYEAPGDLRVELVQTNCPLENVPKLAVFHILYSFYIIWTELSPAGKTIHETCSCRYDSTFSSDLVKYITDIQPTSTCCKSTMEAPKHTEICSKLTVRTSEWRHVLHSGVLFLTLNSFHRLFCCFIVDFEQVNAG